MTPGITLGEPPPLRARLLRVGVMVGVVVTYVGLATSGWYACPTARLFGIPCPGCGLTRASLALLRGDVGEAWRFHPLVFLLLPLLAFSLGALVVGEVTGHRPGSPARRRVESAVGWLWMVAFGAMVVLWGLRALGMLGGPVPV